MHVPQNNYAADRDPWGIKQSGSPTCDSGRGRSHPLSARRKKRRLTIIRCSPQGKSGHRTRSGTNAAQREKRGKDRKGRRRKERREWLRARVPSSLRPRTWTYYYEGENRCNERPFGCATSRNDETAADSMARDEEREAESNRRITPTPFSWFSCFVLKCQGSSRSNGGGSPP